MLPNLASPGLYSGKLFIIFEGKNLRQKYTETDVK